MLNQNLQTKKFWNSKEINDYFASKPADERVIKFLMSQFEYPNNSIKVLDLGSGGGRHIYSIKKLGFDVYGCDVNPEMIEYSRKAYSNAGGTSVDKHIVYGEILNIPFEDEMFNFVVTTGVLHQAIGQKEYTRAIHELSRVLKPGGGVALNIFTNKVMDDTFIIGEEKSVVITKEGLKMTLLSKSEFYKLMQEAGLQLFAEISEDIKNENTGPRAVLRANFIKK